MKKFWPRVASLVFRNWFTMLATVALLLGVVVLIRFVVYSWYNQYARSTFMKPFYDKVALAEHYSRDLPLDHFVSRATTHANETSGRGGLGWLQNCTVSGTYFDQNHQQTNNVRFCSYGYISYFWVNALDDKTIDNAAQQMQAAGWTLTDDAESQTVNKERANSTLIGGYTFTRSGGLKAEMMFINKPMQLQNSDSFSAYPYWDFVNSTTDPHSFFLAVEVSYAARLEGDRLVSE